MKPSISMITLGVSDLDRAIEFYEHGLGFPRMDSPPEVAFFTLGGMWLALWGRKPLAEDGGVIEWGEGFAGFALAHNVASEAEVDEVLAQAAAAGARITRPPAPTDWGGYSGYFSDPDDFLWEVAYNPQFHVGPAS